MIRPAVVATVAVAAMALTACTGSSAGPKATVQAQATATSGLADLHGMIPDQHDPEPEFTLTDTSGRRYDLAAHAAGKALLLYFGYTHCPDECPTSMADVAAALRRTPPQVASKILVVFVTTDPWRDTAPVLRRWLDRFNSSFVGLTGKPAEIAGVETQMGMPISKREPAKKGQGVGRYSVAHFAAVWAYGRDGRLATLYPSGVQPGDIAADLPVLVKG